jgi:hypothetical protein
LPLRRRQRPCSRPKDSTRLSRPSRAFTVTGHRRSTVTSSSSADQAGCLHSNHELTDADGGSRAQSSTWDFAGDHRQRARRLIGPVWFGSGHILRMRIVLGVLPRDPGTRTPSQFGRTESETSSFRLASADATLRDAGFPAAGGVEVAMAADGGRDRWPWACPAQRRGRPRAWASWAVVGLT